MLPIIVVIVSIGGFSIFRDGRIFVIDCDLMRMGIIIVVVVVIQLYFYLRDFMVQLELILIIRK